MAGLPPVQSNGIPPHARPGGPLGRIAPGRRVAEEIRVDAGRTAPGRRLAPGRPDVTGPGLDRPRLISVPESVAAGLLTDDDLVNGARQPHAATTPGRSRQTTRDGGRERAEVLVQARAFEALLVQNLVHELRDKGLSEGFFGDGVGGDVYGFMFDTHMAGALADRLSLGLAEQMADQLERRGAASVPPLPALSTEMLLAASGVAFRPQDSTLPADKRIEEGEEMP